MSVRRCALTLETTNHFYQTPSLPLLTGADKALLLASADLIFFKIDFIYFLFTFLHFFKFIFVLAKLVLCRTANIYCWSELASV